MSPRDDKGIGAMRWLFSADWHIERLAMGISNRRGTCISEYLVACDSLELDMTGTPAGLSHACVSARRCDSWEASIALNEKLGVRRERGATLRFQTSFELELEHRPQV